MRFGLQCQAAVFGTTTGAVSKFPLKELLERNKILETQNSIKPTFKISLFFWIDLGLRGDAVEDRLCKN